MSLEQQLLKVKKELQDVRNNMVRTEAQKEMKLKELARIGAKSPKEARKLIDQWGAQRAKIEKKIQQHLDVIEEQYSEHF